MERDEVSYLLERMERQEIDVEKPRTLPAGPGVASERARLLQLIHDSSNLLRSGEWVKKNKLIDLCRRYDTSFDLFGELLGLCESDDGKWISWPNDSTPETEPRKTRRKS